MVSWRKVAEFVEKEYDTQVDWEERFFICPDCGEPIYEDDYPELAEESNEEFVGYCPVCEEMI